MAAPAVPTQLPADAQRLLQHLLAATPDLNPADRAALTHTFARAYKFGLVWNERPDQPEAVETLLRTHLPTLTEVPERYVAPAAPAAPNAPAAPDLFTSAQPASPSPLEQRGPGGEDAATTTIPQHTLIEGDNLHALTVLAYTHAARVDVIYIDPPYNTGNKDFRYNDSFVDRDDDFRHSKWLTFMHKRLKLAKELLKETGVIFISIDDNEQAPLKLLCDEVFGEENFVANVIWQKKQSPQADATYFSDMHDYIIVYAKRAKKNKNDTEGWKRKLMARTEDQIDKYKNPDNDERGGWISVDMTSNKTHLQRPNLYYSVINPSTGVEVWPNQQTVWRFSKESFQQLIDEDRVFWGSGKSNFPRQKRFLSEVQDGVVPSTWWTREFAGDNQSARKEMRTILGTDKVDFDTPKPVKLIDQILRVSAPSNALILDFFAGSGTTLHATMALNAEDGGQRQCILVTNNENGIAEQVCYERNRRVMQGYTTPKGVAVAGLGQNALRYYRCELADGAPTLRARRALVLAAADLLRFKEACYLPVAAPAPVLAWQQEGSTPARYLVLVPDPSALDSARALLDTLLAADPDAAAAPTAPRAALYCFADGEDPYTDELADLQARGCTLCALPAALLAAYRQAARVRGGRK